MRFVLIHPDYPEFLGWLYGHRPGLADQPYEDQMRVRAESLFGVADFYSSALRSLGHDAWDIYPFNEFMDEAWLREKDRPVPKRTLGAVSRQFARSVKQTLRNGGDGPSKRLKSIFRPLLRSLRTEEQRRVSRVLADQIGYYDPDVVINYAVGGARGSVVRKIVPKGRLLVGQIASPLPRDGDYDSYDLILSSLPNFVDYFRHLGVRAELLRLAFEPNVLDRLEGIDGSIPVSFVGSVTWAHGSRAELLEHLCEMPEFEVWGHLASDLARDSPIRDHYKGQAWGLGMYEVLARSRITVNHHIDAAESFANNLRLFEATGVGAMLLTDWKENLQEMFEPEKEVVTYRTHDECAEKVRYYMEHDDERKAIAQAGQKRTLNQHTYQQRVEELLGILELSGARTWSRP